MPFLSCFPALCFWVHVSKLNQWAIYWRISSFAFKGTILSNGRHNEKLYQCQQDYPIRNGNTLDPCPLDFLFVIQRTLKGKSMTYCISLSGSVLLKGRSWLNLMWRLLKRSQIWQRIEKILFTVFTIDAISQHKVISVVIEMSGSMHILNKTNRA